MTKHHEDFDYEALRDTVRKAKESLTVPTDNQRDLPRVANGYELGLDAESIKHLIGGWSPRYVFNNDTFQTKRSSQPITSFALCRPLTGYFVRI